MWGIWGSYYNIPKAIFNLLKGDYRDSGLGTQDQHKSPPSPGRKWSLLESILPLTPQNPKTLNKMMSLGNPTIQFWPGGSATRDIRSVWEVQGCPRLHGIVGRAADSYVGICKGL